MFNKNDWHLEQELDVKTNEMKIIIIRNDIERNGIRYILGANGVVTTVPVTEAIDNICGPTIRIPLNKYAEFEKTLDPEKKEG